MARYGEQMIQLELLQGEIQQTKQQIAKLLNEAAQPQPPQQPQTEGASDVQ